MRYLNLQQGIRKLGATCALLMGIGTSVAQAGLIGYYKFEETTGTTTANEVSALSPGAIGSNVDQGQAGVVGNAFGFKNDASQDGIVDMGNAADIFDAINASGQYSVSVWLNTNSVANGRNVAVYLGNGSDSNDYADLGITVADGSLVQGGVYARNRQDRNSGFGALGSSTVVATTDPEPREWHHVAYVVDTNTETGTLYIDGVEEDSDTGGGFSTFPAFDNFELGRLGRGAPVDAYTGLIDELQIYDMVLSPSQVRTLHANPGMAVPEPSCLLLLAAPLSLFAYRRLRA